MRNLTRRWTKKINFCENQSIFFIFQKEAGLQPCWGNAIRYSRVKFLSTRRFYFVQILHTLEFCFWISPVPIPTWQLMSGGVFRTLSRQGMFCSCSAAEEREWMNINLYRRSHQRSSKHYMSVFSIFCRCYAEFFSVVY